MAADRVASQLFDLGLRVLDVFSVDEYDVYVISGIDGRVRDVVIFAGEIVIDAFAKPSWFDNWARFPRKINSGVVDDDIHVVLKLLEGTQGLGVVLAENQNAAQSVLEAFNGLKARVIVQEFIKEAKGADIRAFVVDGEVVEKSFD